MNNLKIHLISRDAQLERLCQEVLLGLDGGTWDFTSAPPDGHPRAADLYVWDLDAGTTIPEDLVADGMRKNIFLVNRNDLPAVSSRLPAATGGVLLKPVNPATLLAFLEHAVSSYEPGAQDQGLAGGDSVADREELLQCLLHANLKLQEYDQDRTNFLARALHDFRAPLTAAQGYCGLLLEHKFGTVNDEQIEVLQRMQRSIQRLSRVAAAMYQLSVAGQVRKDPDLRPADIEACVEQALYEVMFMAEEKRIDINVQLQRPARTLYIEPPQIEQVLINLLENACKFTPKQGSIEIKGYPFFWERRILRSREAEERPDRRKDHSQEPNAFRVDILDSGPGIPAHHLPNIFEEYTSYSNGQDRSGGGLGLAICRMIVSSHRGRIWAESNREGAGFSFVLPFREPIPAS